MKKNAIAVLSFTSFAALEAHLGRWMVTPIFERDERATRLPLPTTAMPVRDRRVKRRVSTDCFVDVDTIRYSVPHGLVKRVVEVLVGDTEVVLFDGRVEVARHRRHFEPFQRISAPRHFGAVAQRLDGILSQAARKEPTYVDFLDQILAEETEAKQKKRRPTSLSH